jgi:hypothetical protein
MNLMLMRDQGQISCQSLPSLPTDPPGQTFPFSAGASPAVNAIKASVGQRRNIIQSLQFINIDMGSIFPPQAFWISSNIPHLRMEDLRALRDRSPQDAERANELHSTGRNSAGEAIHTPDKRVVLPDNCHPWVRVWASLNEFFMVNAEIEFLNCPRPAGQPMRLIMHLAYIWARVGVLQRPGNWAD